jgi:hypothetical protein
MDNKVQKIIDKFIRKENSKDQEAESFNEFDNDDDEGNFGESFIDIKRKRLYKRHRK